jgi:hypothetical protein
MKSLYFQFSIKYLGLSVFYNYSHNSIIIKDNQEYSIL